MSGLAFADVPIHRLGDLTAGQVRRDGDLDGPFGQRIEFPEHSVQERTQVLTSRLAPCTGGAQCEHAPAPGKQARWFQRRSQWCRRDRRFRSQQGHSLLRDLLCDHRGQRQGAGEYRRRGDPSRPCRRLPTGGRWRLSGGQQTRIQAGEEDRFLDEPLELSDVHDRAQRVFPQLLKMATSAQFIDIKQISPSGRGLGEIQKEWRMRAEQRIRGGGTGRIRPVGNEAGVMGSTPNPFEIKGILDTRLSRELPWEDVLCVEKWWKACRLPAIHAPLPPTYVIR